MPVCLCVHARERTESEMCDTQKCEEYVILLDLYAMGHENREGTIYTVYFCWTFSVHHQYHFFNVQISDEKWRRKCKEESKINKNEKNARELNSREKILPFEMKRKKNPVMSNKNLKQFFPELRRKIAKKRDHW